MYFLLDRIIIKAWLDVMRFGVVIWADQFLREHPPPLELAGVVANKVFTD